MFIYSPRTSPNPCKCLEIFLQRFAPGLVRQSSGARDRPRGRLEGGQFISDVVILSRAKKRQVPEVRTDLYATPPHTINWPLAEQHDVPGTAPPRIVPTMTNAAIDPPLVICMRQVRNAIDRRLTICLDGKNSA